MDERGAALERMNAAIRQFRAGATPDQRCVWCDGLILVDGHGATVYVTCPCKRSSGVWKGL